MASSTEPALRLLRATRHRVATALGRNAAAPAARGLTVLPDDVFLVSYPRSGNIWLRFLLANVLDPHEQATFATVGNVVPDIYDVTDRDLLRRRRPRILKSHEPFDPRYPRVVYLVRNPADVGLSYYHYLIKMRVLEPGYELEAFVDRFVAGSLDEFGALGDHVEGWLAGSGLVLRYEDVLRDPGEALAKILGLLGAAADEAKIATAVERSSADELRRLERETGTTSSTLRASRLDRPFIRTARAGAAADELPAELVSRILEAWPRTAARLGYA
jgi:hypothetical protein